MNNMPIVSPTPNPMLPGNSTGNNKVSPTHNTHTPPHKPVLRIQSGRYRSRHLLIDMPIGTRLTLGFLIAAVIAALVSGTIGFQHAQAASRQSDFYKSLLQTNTSLTTGGQYLQVMHSQVDTIIQAMDTQQQSQETLSQDKQSLSNLMKLYNTLLTNYINQDQLTKHPEQEAVLAAAGRSYQIQQQTALTASALRTWRIQQSSLNDLMQDFNTNNISQAKYLQQVQVDPTNADALSAIRALTQFNSRLADSVGLAEQAESQQETITTIISSIIAFILVVLVGLFISGTIIRRLRQLRQVTQAVEQGQLDRRVQVIGRDEIADVSASVNAMLDTMLGLLEETRNQRDALTNAAAHLFTEMRVVSAGDLRINAPVSDDPIGMLANAFNFTVGRFRRFAQHTKGTAEQLDVLSHQQAERAENFTQNLLYLKNKANRPQVDAMNAGLYRNATSDANLQQVLQELFKQGTSFANDIHGGAQQMRALGQGIRTNIINFQLDATDKTNNLTGVSNPGIAPLWQASPRQLAQSKPSGFSSNPNLRPKISQTRLSSLSDEPTTLPGSSPEQTQKNMRHSRG